MELLEGLTAAQREAATHVDGPLLILAGAGSGKTRTITHRIAYLIQQGIPSWQILALTFTNKAAEEMKTRVQDLIFERGVWISTFHSLCARLLRKEIEHLKKGYTTDFAIYDTEDRKACILEAMKAHEIDSKNWPVSGFAYAIGDAKARLRSPEDVAREADNHADRMVSRVYRTYEELLLTRNALDFDDLLLRMVELLDVETVRESLQHRFQYILIDEYQDTNLPQYEIADRLARGHRNIAVCGDPDQSIYAWRGADIRNILEFEANYPDCRVIRLEQNWRSTKHILGAAQGLISHNVARKEKDLFTDNPEGEPIRIVTVRNHREEASFVARHLRERIRDGISPREMAIFYRTNAFSRHLERALMYENLPYQVVGAVEFYRRKEIKDTLAWLRMLANPRDDLSCLRIINTPSRGIGAKTISRLQNAASKAGMSILEAVEAGAYEDALPTRARRAVDGFREIVAALRAYGTSPVLPLVQGVLEETGYRAPLEEMGGPKETERLENLDQFCEAAAEYDQNRSEGGLQGFLEEIALISDTDKWDPDEKRVSLMTLHSAKGLEFDEVIIVGLEEKNLPHSRSSTTPEGVEEERRLLYVGMTRARKRLTMTMARYRERFGTEEPRRPSPFLGELPREHVDTPTRARPRSPSTPATGETEKEVRVRGGGSSPSDLTAGERVTHDVFGTGTILELRGRGPARRAVIRFDDVGRKVLALHYAQLVRSG